MLTPKLTLPPQSDIREADTLYTQIEECLDLGSDLIIDAMAVERIDTSVFQLLLAANKTLATQNKQLLIVNPSAVFIKSKAILGLSIDLFSDKLGVGAVT